MVAPARAPEPQTLEFLRSSPGNNLEALKGDRKEQHSIRVNDQGRVCFVWTVTRIHQIVKKRRSVTADTAARLAKYFEGDGASWLVLQANYDLKTLATLRDIARQVHARESLAA